MVAVSFDDILRSIFRECVVLELCQFASAKNSLRAMISNMGVLNPEEGCNVICLAAQIAIDVGFSSCCLLAHCCRF